MDKFTTKNYDNLIHNTEWLEHICDKFLFPNQAKKELVDCFEIIKKSNDAYNIFYDTIKEYYNNYQTTFQNLISKIQTSAKISGVNEYTAYTVFLIYILAPLDKFYKQNGYALEMWEGVALDIKYKLLECYDLYGVYGTFAISWFDRFFNLTRFCFGRLQMETVELDGNYTVNGVNLNEGDIVLSVHIPRSGEPLHKDQVELSYNRARNFYKDIFTLGYTVFTCKSYLLHSSTLSFLKKDSNLYKFASDYQIVYYEDYKDYTELWRLYDCNVINTDINSLPQNTSLRKKFVEYMMSGKKIGYGHGIFVQK